MFYYSTTAASKAAQDTDRNSEQKLPPFEAFLGSYHANCSFEACLMRNKAILGNLAQKEFFFRLPQPNSFESLDILSLIQ